jgi:hypothetical protein
MAAFALGAAVGYSVTNRLRTQEIVRLRQERDNGLVRERELRAQLEEALAARAALAQEAKHLQEDLMERLRRLEDAASRLALPGKPAQDQKD